MGQRLRGVAPGEPARTQRSAAGALGRRRERGEERQPQPRGRAAIRQGDRRPGRGGGGTGRGLHGEGRRCARHRADRQSRARHAPYGSVPGGRLAPPRFRSAAQGRADQVGVGPVSAPPRRAVFLDRDGVLNRAIVRNGRPYPPAALADLEILPDAPAALGALRAAGLVLIGVTNQPDVARGTQRRGGGESMHAAPRQARPRPRGELPGRRSMEGCRGREGGGLCRRPDRLRLRGVRTRQRGAGPHRRITLRRRGVDSATTRHTGRTTMTSVSALRVKLFADGADKAGMLEMYRKPMIKGFTTNPTLMRKAGIADYRAFAREILCAITDRPISFEVFSDEFDEMERQAREIAEWGENVYVKIRVTNTRGESSRAVIRSLTRTGIKVNVTALLTLDQVREVSSALAGGAPACVSVFAGRIADTGRDPVPLMASAVEILRPTPAIELIWASPRELLNIFQADAIGCHIITATNDILGKLHLVGKELQEYSLDTVKMFRDDAVKAGFSL